jgi:hypothetical protein
MRGNVPKSKRDGYIVAAVPEYPRNMQYNSERLNSSFLQVLEPRSSEDSYDWKSSFKSNLIASKKTDQNWSIELAESYFKKLNSRDKSFNSSTHNYEELFDNRDDKISFLDNLSSLIQDLVYKGKVKEKNPILVIENQNPLIQNYIKIAHKNLGIEGPGNESLDSSSSSANDGKKINEITAIAREKIEILSIFSRGHYQLGKIDIDKELEEIKSFLKENKKHPGATPSPSSTNRDPQSPSFLRTPPSSKSPTALTPRYSEPTLLQPKKVDLENLLNELSTKYTATEKSQRRAKLFAEPETRRAQSPEASAHKKELFEGKGLQSRLGLFAETTTPTAQSPEALRHTEELFPEPTTPRDEPSEDPSPRKNFLEKKLSSQKLLLPAEPKTQPAQSHSPSPSTKPLPSETLSYPPVPVSSR